MKIYHGASVKDAVVRALHTHAVDSLARDLAGADADVAEDDVGGAGETDRETLDHNALAGGRLASDGDVLVVN